MWRVRIKYRRSVRPSVVLALLFLNSLVYSQNLTRNDTINIVRPDKLIRSSFFANDTLTVNQRNLIPLNISDKDKSLIFFDSLKVKASKKLITKTLYDLLIVSNVSGYKKQITSPSDLNYLQYSGRNIRNIEIRQLGVFGANIDNPLSSDTNKLVNLLNKTHINTNEIIIRKNLLFSEGDTVSPLTLSDNERIIRQLPYIDDARIIIVPVSDEDVDIVVLTRDIYSLGADFSFSDIKKGSVSVFEKNIFGFGHEFGLEIPYDSELPGSPGFGIEYQADNIAKTFINLNLYYFDGLGRRTYGFDLSRKLISSTTKYAGGISVREMFTSEDLDTMLVPEPLKYRLQDYWLSRSFLIDRESVSRIILGARYTNNNVFDHPFILPDSYHYLQKYRMFLGSLAYSIQKFYKANLIYGYGRTEDIPYGALLNMTLGKEINEFKKRIYAGINLSFGESVQSLGYFYTSAGFATFLNENRTEQGLLSFRTNFISNLIRAGRYRIRNFVNFDYTRGFGRYSDEHLIFSKENGFSGFRNDSIGDNQRLCISLESVLFSPINIYGFRCAFFGFADLGYLFGANEFAGSGEILSGLGLGIRIRNDNLVLKTFQIRIGFFPNLPLYSRVRYLLVSGEQLLTPHNFEPGPPSLIPFN